MLYQAKNSVGQDFFECLRYTDFFFVPHRHRHPELICVRQGQLVVETDGREERIGQGEYALILPNRIHAYRSPVPTVVDVCIVSEDRIPMFAREIRGKRAAASRFCCSPTTAAFADEHLFWLDGEPPRYALKAALYAIAGEFLSQVALTDSNLKDEELIDRIIRYVDEHYTEPLTLTRVADDLGYERHYLSRYFHSRIPMNFTRYVNWYRVDAATELLRNTTLSMTEIALQSGFQSIRNFNRVYAEMTGASPSASR